VSLGNVRTGFAPRAPGDPRSPTRARARELGRPLDRRDPFAVPERCSSSAKRPAHAGPRSSTGFELSPGPGSSTGPCETSARAARVTAGGVHGRFAVRVRVCVRASCSASTAKFGRLDAAARGGSCARGVRGSTSRPRVVVEGGVCPPVPLRPSSRRGPRSARLCWRPRGVLARGAGIELDNGGIPRANLDAPRAPPPAGEV
jgi:hypothetical protein